MVPDATLHTVVSIPAPVAKNVHHGQSQTIPGSSNSSTLDSNPLSTISCTQKWHQRQCLSSYGFESLSLQGHEPCSKALGLCEQSGDTRSVSSPRRLPGGTTLPTPTGSTWWPHGGSMSQSSLFHSSGKWWVTHQDHSGRGQLPSCGSALVPVSTHENHRELKNSQGPG